MKDALEFAESLLKSHGLGYVFLLALIVLGSFWAYTAIKKWGAQPPAPAPTPEPVPVVAPEVEEERDDYVEATKDLTQHMLFAYLRHAIKVKIPHLPIEEPMRREAFRDMLTIKCEVFQNNMGGFLVTHPDLEELGDDFYTTVLNLVTDSVNEYEMKATAAGIPKEAVTAFAKWHEKAVNMVYDLITSTGSSRFYENNTVKMIAILDWVLAAFQITMVDAQKAMDSLNGELDGKTYKGIKAHCKDGSKCDTCDKPAKFLHNQEPLAGLHSDRSGK